MSLRLPASSYDDHMNGRVVGVVGGVASRASAAAVFTATTTARSTVECDFCCHGCYTGTVARHETVSRGHFVLTECFIPDAWLF